MNILVTGALSCADECMEEMRKMGHTTVFMQNEADALPCCADSVEGVVCNGLFLHHPIEKFTGLKYIQLTSAGFDRVPTDYVREHNIMIYNARGVYSIPMAEFALCGVLQLYKKSRFFTENQKKCIWEKHRGLTELYGRTVCIVGCGSVGTECAKRFKAFGTSVISVDILKPTADCYDIYYTLENIGDAVSEADIVILTLPLTDDTRNMFDKNMFDKMKGGAVLVNIARGAIVNGKALLEALKSGKLFGAVLDVFEEEPLGSDDALWRLENVVLTPHNSFVSDGNSARLKEVLINNLNNITKAE